MKEIRGFVFEILFVICLLFVTYFIWTKDEDSIAMAKSLANNDVLELNILKDNNITISPIEDEDAINTNYNNIVFSISKSIDNIIDYRLVMQVSKKDIDYSKLKVKVNDLIFNLDDYYLFEDDNYVYFNLLTNSLKNKSDDVDFMIWLDKNTTNYSDYTFMYRFYVEKV